VSPFADLMTSTRGTIKSSISFRGTIKSRKGVAFRRLDDQYFDRDVGVTLVQLEHSFNIHALESNFVADAIANVVF